MNLEKYVRGPWLTWMCAHGWKICRNDESCITLSKYHSSVWIQLYDSEDVRCILPGCDRYCAPDAKSIKFVALFALSTLPSVTLRGPCLFCAESKIDAHYLCLLHQKQVREVQGTLDSYLTWMGQGDSCLPRELAAEIGNILCELVR
jgi:hypothetical protein